MGQTVTEKILAAHADVETCTPGQVLRCRPDLVMGHDLTAPHAIYVFRQFGIESVRDPEKLVLVQDHFQPAKDIPSAELGRMMREFAREQKIRRHFEVGWGGICHVLMLEKGLVAPGMLVAGADSHTCTCGAVGAIGWAVGATDLAALWALGDFWVEVPKTRRIVLQGELPRWVTGKDIILSVLSLLGQEGATNEALEFTGESLDALTMVDRITIANMSAEAGASTAIITPNRIVEEYLSGRCTESWTAVEGDPDATYVDEHVTELGRLGPLVAAPHSPANVKPVEEFSEVRVDQVFLGSCVNGGIEDLRRFVEVLGERSFTPEVRVMVIPATQEVYTRALREGIVERIVDAGGAVQTPSCGPCVGGHSGVLGAGEVCLSTSNRNFRGRMGHGDSEVYLAGPPVAAATAVTGRITHPAEVAG